MGPGYICRTSGVHIGPKIYCLNTCNNTYVLPVLSKLRKGGERKGKRGTERERKREKERKRKRAREREREREGQKDKESRAGNSLIRFPSETLVFCQK